MQPKSKLDDGQYLDLPKCSKQIWREELKYYPGMLQDKEQDAGKCIVYAEGLH